jgi:hypothetical protein
MQIYNTFLKFPLSIKLVWFSIILQLILIIVPLIRCVSYGSELTTCASSLEMRIAVLLFLFTPLAIYMTHTHMKLTHGQGLFNKNPFLKDPSTSSGDSNANEVQTNDVIKNKTSVVRKNNTSVGRKNVHRVNYTMIDNVPKNNTPLAINSTMGSGTNVKIAPAKSLDMFESARKF